VSEKPEPHQDGEDARPWERGGLFPRDCEPHRNGLLVLLVRVAFACALLSACAPPACLLSVVAGLSASALAARDIELMLEGQKDPSGLEQAGRAYRMGFWATWLSIGLGALSLCVLLRTPVIKLFDLGD
jgi:hypothetical protein